MNRTAVGLTRPSTRHSEKKDVDARAFAAPKGLRPRRRDEPGHDELNWSWRMREGSLTSKVIAEMTAA